MARAYTPMPSQIGREKRSQAVVSDDERMDYWDRPDDWEPTFPLVFWSVAWMVCIVSMGWGGYVYP